MRNCGKHGGALVFKTGTSAKGPWQMWSCPVKEGDKYCQEKEWAAGKTPAEEMVNLLAQILAAVKAPKTPVVRSSVPEGCQTADNYAGMVTARPVASQPTERAIPLNEIPF
jgi:hypothetical protein